MESQTLYKNGELQIDSPSLISHSSRRTAQISNTATISLGQRKRPNLQRTRKNNTIGSNTRERVNAKTHTDFRPDDVTSVWCIGACRMAIAYDAK